MINSIKPTVNYLAIEICANSDITNALTPQTDSEARNVVVEVNS